MIGSANFDNRSFELNDELTVAVDDVGLSQALTTAFERDLTRAHRLTAAEWRQRPMLEREFDAFWGLFNEVL